MVLPAGTEPEQALPPGTPGLETLTSTLDIDGVPHALVAGAPAALQALAQRVNALKGSLHDVPPWLQADPGINAGLRAAAPGGARVRALGAERHASPRCMRNTICLARWATPTACNGCCTTCARSKPARCSAGSPAGPATPMAPGWPRRCSAARPRALLRYAAPPAGLRPPLLLNNPAWARPFELFSRALGMPVVERGRPDAAAGRGRAADVRLHVRRRRPGPGHRRRGLAVPPALPDRPPADGRRRLGQRLRAALRQPVQPARPDPGALVAPARRAAGRAAGAADRRRRAADRGARARCAGRLVARRDARAGCSPMRH